jgi:hypothetical protein
MEDFRLDPSVSPPGGLKKEEVPQFIVCSFDDNYLCGRDRTGGLSWITGEFARRRNPAGNGNPGTFDGSPPHFTFFVAPEYRTARVEHDPEKNRVVFLEAVEQGHELAVHTLTHRKGVKFKKSEWEKEISGWKAWFKKPGNPHFSRDPLGFRAPYLRYNPAMFEAIVRQGLVYDSSLEEGFAENQDGTNFLWPFTMDSGSPSSALNAVLFDKPQIGAYPGLIEIPIYALVPPPDSEASGYGIPTGLAGRAVGLLKDPAVWNVKITGIDWNLFYLHRLDQKDILAILKHTLDRRVKGNRCPMTLGFHSDIYTADYEGETRVPFGTRQEILAEFLDHALAMPDSRLVSNEELIGWLHAPVPLGGRRADGKVPA